MVRSNPDKEIMKLNITVMVEFLESEKIYPKDLVVEIYAQNTIFEIKTKILNMVIPIIIQKIVEGEGCDNASNIHR